MIRYRLAKWEDLGQLTAIEQASFPDPWTTSMLEAELNQRFSRFYAAEEDGRLLGYCILRLVFGDAEIFNIAVAPEGRGRGVGEGLLRHALASAAGDAECVFLEVRESNAAARALYEKLGFAVTGKRPGYYFKPREDAILMTFRYEEEEKC